MLRFVGSSEKTYSLVSELSSTCSPSLSPRPIPTTRAVTGKMTSQVGVLRFSHPSFIRNSLLIHRALLYCRAAMMDPVPKVPPWISGSSSRAPRPDPLGESAGGGDQASGTEIHAEESDEMRR